MKTIKREIRNPKFTNKKYMLLGRRKDGNKIWLEQASFDCDWYYGFGYLEVVNHRRTDIDEHYHFDSLFAKFGLDKFNEEFKESVLSESELWTLFDLMRTFYILKDVSGLYHSGTSHYTSHTPLSLKNEEKYKEALCEQAKIIKEVQKLLGLSEEDNTILKE